MLGNGDPVCGPRPAAAAAANHESRLLKCGDMIGGASGMFGINRFDPSATDNSFGVNCDGFDLLVPIKGPDVINDCDEVGEWQFEVWLIERDVIDGTIEAVVVDGDDGDDNDEGAGGPFGEFTS